MSSGANQNYNERNKAVMKELGKKSIFYDPEWNPEGYPPPGEKSLPYNESTFKRRTEVNPLLAGLDPKKWKDPK